MDSPRMMCRYIRAREKWPINYLILKTSWGTKKIRKNWFPEFFSQFFFPDVTQFCKPGKLKLVIASTPTVPTPLKKMIDSGKKTWKNAKSFSSKMATSMKLFVPLFLRKLWWSHEFSTFYKLYEFPSSDDGCFTTKHVRHTQSIKVKKQQRMGCLLFRGPLSGRAFLPYFQPISKLKKSTFAEGNRFYYYHFYCGAMKRLFENVTFAFTILCIRISKHHHLCLTYVPALPSICIDPVVEHKHELNNNYNIPSNCNK